MVLYEKGEWGSNGEKHPADTGVGGQRQSASHTGGEHIWSSTSRLRSQRREIDKLGMRGGVEWRG